MISADGRFLGASDQAARMSECHMSGEAGMSGGIQKISFIQIDSYPDAVLRKPASSSSQLCLVKDDAGSGTQLTVAIASVLKLALAAARSVRGALKPARSRQDSAAARSPDPRKINRVINTLSDSANRPVHSATFRFLSTARTSATRPDLARKQLNRRAASSTTTINNPHHFCLATHLYHPTSATTDLSCQLYLQ